MRSVPAVPEKNLPRMAEWVTRAKQQEADLVCFPELAVTGYIAAPDIWYAAEPVPSPSTEQLAELAHQAGLHFAAGVAERGQHDLVYNAYVFVAPEGYLGKSRKLHIPPAEVGYWRGGGVSPVIDISGWLTFMKRRLLRGMPVRRLMAAQMSSPMCLESLEASRGVRGCASSNRDIRGKRERFILSAWRARYWLWWAVPKRGGARSPVLPFSQRERDATTPSPQGERPCSHLWRKPTDKN